MPRVSSFGVLSLAVGQLETIAMIDPRRRRVILGEAAPWPFPRHAEIHCRYYDPWPDSMEGPFGTLGSNR